MIRVFLVLMMIVLACFGLIIWLIFLALQKDSIDLDFQTIWKSDEVTRSDMDFK